MIGAVVWFGGHRHDNALYLGRIEVQHLAAIQGQHVAGGLGAVDFALTKLAKELSEGEVDGSFSAIGMHYRIRDQLTYLGQLVDIRIFDETGTLVLSGRQYPPAPGPSQAQKKFFIDHRDRWVDFSLGKPEQMDGRNRWIIPMSRRISDRDGVFKGVVQAQINPAYFTELHYNDGLSRQADAIATFKPNGDVLFQWSAPTDSLAPGPYSITDLPGFDGIGEIPQGTRSFESDDRLISVFQIPDFALHLAVSQSKETLLAGWREEVRLLVVLIGIGIFGAFALAVAALQQTRQRRAAEALLLESEERHRSIIATAQEGYWEVDHDGKTIAVNDALCHLLGYDAAEMMGTKPIDFVPERQHEEFLKNFDKRREQLHRDYMTIFRRRDGSECFTHLYATRRVSPDGRFLGSFALVADVTKTQTAFAALKASETRYRSVIDALQDGLVVIRDGFVHFVNDKLAAMLGVRLEEILGRPFEIWVAEADRPLALEHYRKVLDDNIPIRDLSIRLRRADGGEINVFIHAGPSIDENGLPGIVATIKDVTAQRKASEERHLLTRAINVSMVPILITDRAGIIVYANPTYAKTTGYEADELVGRNTSLIKSGLTPNEIYRDLWDHLETGRVWQGDLHNRRRDGSLFWQHSTITPVRDEADNITHFVQVAEDVTEQKEHANRVWRQANYDSLTNLPNRSLFHDRLVHAMARSRRDGSGLAVMFVDLDKFKAVNDTLGHEAGDDLLRQISARFAACLRDSDTVARMGGDEFVVLLRSFVELEQAAEIAERLVETASQPFHLAGTEVLVGASIGIAVFPRDADDEEDLLQRADAAMYDAKASGRNCFKFYDATLNAA